MADDVRVSRLVDPTEEPCTLSEVKTAIRVDHDEEDALISSYISAARGNLEQLTQRSFMDQTWILSAQKWPGRDVELPYGPVQSVSSVKYYDADEVQQTLDSSLYQVDLDSDLCRIRPTPDDTWPTIYPGRYDAIEITYVTGYGGGSSGSNDVPSQLKVAIYLLVGHYYRNREAVVFASANELPMGVKALIAPFVVTWSL